MFENVYDWSVWQVKRSRAGNVERNRGRSCVSTGRLGFWIWAFLCRGGVSIMGNTSGGISWLDLSSFKSCYQNTKNCLRFGKFGAVLHCWWEYKMHTYFGNQFTLSSKVIYKTTIGPSISFSREMDVEKIILLEC